VHTPLLKFFDDQTKLSLRDMIRGYLRIAMKECITAMFCLKECYEHGGNSIQHIVYIENCLSQTPSSGLAVKSWGSLAR